MRKKWKRSKNRILVGLLAFLSLFYQIVPTVEASTTIVSTDFTFSHNFPKVYGSLDSSLLIPLNYEKVVSTGHTLDTEKYYLFYFRQPFITQATWKYDPSNSDYVTSNMYAIYGGNKYYFNERMCSFVTSGTNTGTFSIGVDVDINIFPYWADDGYIYANECSVRFYTANASNQNAMYAIYELDESEVADAKQLVEIVNLLGQLEVSLDSVIDNQLLTNLKLTNIGNDIDEILKDTASMDSKLSSVITLLTETNEKLQLIDNELITANSHLYDIYVQVWNLRKELTQQSTSDSDKMEDFGQNSDSQSSQLNELNQQNKVDKIDINSASSTVDSNIDLNAVGSSGVVLSALTGHQKILTMLLGVTAISLIAYVFFGKR